MSQAPIFPQFLAACAEFARPTRFPRPFAALDWCRRCGQPDWAHQAGGPDRLLRLDGLDHDDMTYALTYLAEYSPAAFDTILDALGPADHTLDDPSEVPYCVTCSAPLGIYMADGPYYRHYRDTEDGDHERYSVDHPTLIGWRQAIRP